MKEEGEMLFGIFLSEIIVGLVLQLFRVGVEGQCEEYVSYVEKEFQWMSTVVCAVEVSVA